MEIPDNLTWFRDRQQDPVRGFCPICGREMYQYGAEVCYNCAENKEEYDERTNEET